MVDFGGTGDGRFAVDGCDAGLCAGHLLTDNDFAESSYTDAGDAARVLASHELFHAVQAAYAAELPVWLSEGTATWAEHLYDPENADFIGFCRAYLREPTRSLNRPPSGVVTSWSYGTALFFAFLEERHGVGVGPALLEALEASDEDDGLVAIESVLAERSDGWSKAWPTFVEWNLATGPRAGGLGAGYPFASRLVAPPVEAEGDGLLDDDNRFYPLAATYFALEHAGGPLSLAFVDDPAGLEFRLYPVPTGGVFGQVGEASWAGAPAGVGVVDLGVHPPGTLLLSGTFPAPAPESTKVHFCLGAPDSVETCLADAAEGDTGGVSHDTADSGAQPRRRATPEGGCSVAAGASRAAACVLSLVAVAGRRRRTF
jgi:GNAT superfamily N-acetyltransferase